MTLTVGSTPLTPQPAQFKVTPLDIDDGEATFRSTDGTLTRHRVAVKRQINMTWGILTWAQISTILTLISGESFSLTYPDPLTGADATKTFYVGNRPALAAVDNGTTILWSGLDVTLTEI